MTRGRAIVVSLGVVGLIIAAGGASGAFRAIWPSRVLRATSHRQLLIVLDGLRPDYVTPTGMPNLYAMGQRGVVFENHHSVFPTVTRVNASSISTGSYPERHGLLGNSVFFPQVDAAKFLNTDDRATLQRIDTAVQGNLLTARTLGEILEANNRKLVVVSAGSSGSAFLLNHKVAGGAILHNDFTLPLSLQAQVTAQVGDAASSKGSSGKDHRAVDTFLQVVLTDLRPEVTIMWMTDPDTTAHDKGIGTPETLEALKQLDAEIGRLRDGLSRRGVLDDFDIWVTSDHGFSTHTGAPNLDALAKLAAGSLADGSPRFVSSGGAVYVRDHDATAITNIVAELQRTTGVGAIFTPAGSPGSLDGRVRGTLSFDAIHWQHARSADILFSPDWSDRKNDFGVPGTVDAGGVAGHGSSSPFDVHNTLIAEGPDLKRGETVTSPSGNVDFAPTLLRLLGVNVPDSMQGRVLLEAFATTASTNTTVRASQESVQNADGGYVLEAFFSTIETPQGRYRYLDRTHVTRTR